MCGGLVVFFFFFQAEDGIRDKLVTGVQTCALPIWTKAAEQFLTRFDRKVERARIILQQRGRTEFVPVTIAEPMALAETERLLQELASLGMHPKRLIVNQWV